MAFYSGVVNWIRRRQEEQKQAVGRVAQTIQRNVIQPTANRFVQQSQEAPRRAFQLQSRFTRPVSQPMGQATQLIGRAVAPAFNNPVVKGIANVVAPQTIVPTAISYLRRGQGGVNNPIQEQTNQIRDRIVGGNVRNLGNTLNQLSGYSPQALALKAVGRGDIVSQGQERVRQIISRLAPESPKPVTPEGKFGRGFGTVSKGVSDLAVQVGAVNKASNLIRGAKTYGNLIQKGGAIEKATRAGATLLENAPQDIVYSLQQNRDLKNELLVGAGITAGTGLAGRAIKPFLKSGAKEVANNVPLNEFDDARSTFDDVVKRVEQELQTAQAPVESKAKNVGGEPMYRGASKAEWEAVQKTGKFGKQEAQVGNPKGFFNDDVHTVGNKKYGENYAYTGRADGVLIEYKPSANAKMRNTAVTDTTDLGKVQEARGKGLNIDDVQRVTDRNGNVIYEAGATTYKPGSKVVNGERVSVNSKQVRDVNAKTLKVEEDGDLFEVRIKENNRGDLEYQRYDADGNFMDMTTRAKLEKKWGKLSDEQLAEKSIYGNGRIVTPPKLGGEVPNRNTPQSEFDDVVDEVKRQLDPNINTPRIASQVPVIREVPQTLDDVITQARQFDDPEQFKNAVEPLLRDNPQQAEALLKNLNEQNIGNLDEAFLAAKPEFNQGVEPQGIVGDTVQALDNTVDNAQVPTQASASNDFMGDLDSQAEYDDFVRQAEMDIPENARPDPLTLERQFAESQEPITTRQIDQNAPAYEFKEAKPQFQQATNAFLGGKQAARTTNTQIVRQFPKLNEQESLRLIQAIESISGQDVITDSGSFNMGDLPGLPTEIRQLLDAKFEQLRQAGVDIGYLQNYFPHKWQNEEAVKQAYKAAKIRDGIMESREIPTLEEGMRLGFKPVSTDYRQAIVNYLNAADSVLAGQKYVDDLIKSGLIVEAGARPAGLQVVDAPGFPPPKPHVDPDTGEVIYGAYYADPTVATQLNKAFGADVRGLGGEILRKTSKIASTAQDLGLAGGIPGTPVNAFGVAQAQRHVLGGSLRAPIKGGIISVIPGGANRYFDKYAADLAEIQAQGIPLRTRYAENGIKKFGQRVSELVDSGQSRNKLTAGLKEAWHVAVNDPTFSKFIPIMQTEYYRHVRDNLIRLGVPAEEAAQKAGSRLINFEGLTKMAQTATRSKTGNDAITTFFFAPKYREAMINFWKNNVKALNPANMVKALNPKDGAYRNNMVFNAGALITFLYYDQLNQDYNNGRHLWENPGGLKDKLLVKTPDGRTVGIPFLSSIATMPRAAISTVSDLATGNTNQLGKDVKSFLGYAIRPVLDVAQNENYFGSKIRDVNASPAEQFGQTAKYLFSQLQHPYVKAAINATEPDTGKKKPDYQIASEALELPFRFYGEGSVEGKEFYDRKNAFTKGLNENELALLNKMNPAKEDDFGNKLPGKGPLTKVANYQDLLANPEFAIKYKNWQQSLPDHDPLWDLSPSQLQSYLQAQVISKNNPGGDSDTVRQLYARIPKNFFDVREQYFNNLKSKGVSFDDSQYKPRPEMSPELQKFSDYYNSLPKGTGERKAALNSQIGQQWLSFLDQNKQYNNEKRAELNLPLLPDTTSKYASSGGKSGGGRKGKKLSVKTGKPKKGKKMGGVKIAKVPTGKIKTSKKGKKILAKKLPKKLTSV